jgi:hypothetical protein
VQHTVNLEARQEEPSRSPLALDLSEQAAPAFHWDPLSSWADRAHRNRGSYSCAMNVGTSGCSIGRGRIQSGAVVFPAGEFARIAVGRTADRRHAERLIGIIRRDRAVVRADHSDRRAQRLHRSGVSGHRTLRQTRDEQSRAICPKCCRPRGPSTSSRINVLARGYSFLNARVSSISCCNHFI